MSVTEFIHQDKEAKRFSFEVLPPLKGTGTAKLFADIDKLREFDPAYINITTHHSEFVYHELENGQFERRRIRRRPGTIAIAAAIQQRYQIPVQPHVICSGATIEDIEYELLDLQFLGINDFLLMAPPSRILVVRSTMVWLATPRSTRRHPTLRWTCNT